MDRKLSPPPDRNTKKPLLKTPSGACDTHFHIYGPQERYPFNPNRPMDAEDSTYEDLIKLHDTLGISRGVIVQSLMHGHCYEYMLNALCRDPERFRGVAMPAPDITDGELEILDKAGVVGARFAYRWSADINRNMISRIDELGWHPQFWFRGEEEALAWRDIMIASPGNFVIDHMGWQPAKNGLDSPGFRVVLDCLETGRCWVKLSGPNRFTSEKKLPYSDTLPFAQTLIEYAPERLIWGSDWPHPDHFEIMPNDGEILDLMIDWAPDANIRKMIFSENPKKLFGFS
ncbi:MAG: amidohydrolase family protein [Alphaproteobacteria bacterium]|nr:amidohydrolase family protein [Alphaproteobacteria bacterium]